MNLNICLSYVVKRIQIREFPFDCIVQKLATLNRMTYSKILTCVCFYSNLLCQTFFPSIRFIAKLCCLRIFHFYFHLFFVFLFPCDNCYHESIRLLQNVHTHNLMSLQDVASFSIQYNHIRAILLSIYILVLCTIVFIRERLKSTFFCEFDFI